MIIKRYSDADESPLFDMMKEEGDDWSDYHGEKGRNKYLKTFKCLSLAFEALKAGGTMPAVLNASNEACVKLFLDKKLVSLI
jgi:1-deoxy-D-xylulose 5-phosphate reductoisomerase